MSHASANVLFADGLLMYAEYDGTSDVIRTPLYATCVERNARWREDKWWERECTCGRDEPATYAEDYGGGSYGPIRACRHCGVITNTEHFTRAERGDKSLWDTGPEPHPAMDAAHRQQVRQLVHKAIVDGRARSWARRVKIRSGGHYVRVRLTVDEYKGEIWLSDADDVAVYGDMLEAYGIEVDGHP